MALFFNEQKLASISKQSIDKYLSIFKELVYPTSAPTTKNRFIDFNELRRGTNFILNAKPLIHDPKVDSAFKVQYIKLAALRDYYMYKQYKVKYLDISFYPDLNTEAIKHNPLVTLTQNKLYFKYEEIYGS